MKHSRLIENYHNIFNTQQLDELHDLLTDDFYFKNPKIEIFGKQNYLRYSKENLSIYTTELIKLHANSETEYIREYYLTFLNSSLKSSDRLHIFETLTIENGLISSSVLNYATDHVSDNTKNLMADAGKTHGSMLKK